MTIISDQGYATKKDLETKLKLSARTIDGRLKNLGDEFVVEVGGGNRPTKIYFREENEGEKSDG